MNKRVVVNLIFFNAVFALMLFWAVNNIVTFDAIEKPYTITGDFAQASGVKANAEVTYLGVSYGRVSSVERTDDGVSIAMKIDRDKHIPAGSVARIFRKSAIGEPYIDFVPPEDYDDGNTASIEAGDNVPRERTTVPLEFSELLRSASALISSIDPEAAGGLVHELSLALDGRGEDLRDLTISMDTLTSSFVERTDQLERLAENGTRITQVLADRRLSVGRSIDNLRAVTETLRNAKGDTQALLDVGPDFLRTTADLVADEKQALDCMLTDLAPVLRTLGSPDSVADLRVMLRDGPTSFGYVARAIDHDADGPWIRVNLLMPLEGENPEVYVPPKGLPVVPSVADCASTLTPAAVASGSPSGSPGSDAGSDDQEGAAPKRSDERVAAASDEQGGVRGLLARTGAAPLIGVGLLLLAASAGTWAARRRSARGTT